MKKHQVQATGPLHGQPSGAPLPRRALLELAGATAVAAMLGPLLPHVARATVVEEDDPQLHAGMSDFRSRYGRIPAYLARPRGATAARLGILVLHNETGLDAHIRNVCRRFAVEGFVALAPDFLWQTGGTPDNSDDARARIATLDAGETQVVAYAGVEHLVVRRDTVQRVGVVGFGWGGGLANRVASRPRDLAGVVAFHGQPPDAQAVRGIRTRLMQHYAELDESMAVALPAFQQALDQAGVDYTLHMYEGVNRGFNNVMAQTSFDAEAAELAWSRTVSFFRDAQDSG